MAVRLTTKAVEKSTYVVQVSFYDEAGSPLTPSSVKWTLLDQAGTVVNSRDEVSATPGTTVNIVLSGDDLSLSGYSGDRQLTVEATYDSLYGTDLPLKAAFWFEVEALLAV